MSPMQLFVAQWLHQYASNSTAIRELFDCDFGVSSNSNTTLLANVNNSNAGSHAASVVSVPAIPSPLSAAELSGSEQSGTLIVNSGENFRLRLYEHVCLLL